MRDAYPEFYRPGPDDERRFITDATVVVDANVLLALYELSRVQRDETIAVLEQIGERLWIPYQVGLEYQRNRLNTVQKQAANYTKLVDLHGARDLEGLQNALAGIQVPPEVTREVRPLLADLARQLLGATREYVNAAKAIQERHVVTAEQGIEDDPVRSRLDELFAGRVGQRPDEKTYKERLVEAARRREGEIPPGYKDAKKESEERGAGDYLLWAELLEHAGSEAESGSPFLLVTNDVKEDWYAKSGGRPIGPRPDLVREFFERNTNGYHQVTLEGLLRLAKDHLLSDVGEATIEKASELSQPDFFFSDALLDEVRSAERQSPAKAKFAGSRRHAALLREHLNSLSHYIAETSLAIPSDSDRHFLRRELSRSALDLAVEIAARQWPIEDFQGLAKSKLFDTLETVDLIIPVEISVDEYSIGVFARIVELYLLDLPPHPRAEPE